MTPSATPSPTPTPTTTPTPSPTPTGTGTANRIGGYFLAGANMPWLNFGSDFGGSGGDVASNTAEVDTKLQAAQAAGLHYVRWWMFEGGSPQITRDSSGTPTGLNPAVYTDIDSALTEAAKYDIYFDFTLFGSTNDDSTTHQWWEDPTKRAALTTVLTPLFAHYSGNPRVHTWEIVNEPDWQTRNGITTQAGAINTVNLLADAVHANSSALVTVGQAQIQDIPTWVGSHIDFYSPHYYDAFGATGGGVPWNQPASSPDGKPVVIGEFQAGAGVSQSRYQGLYDMGYAGAWAWSLSPEFTSDGFGIDLAGCASFTIDKTDIGPHV